MIDLDIGASEIAAVLGIDPYKTREQLYAQKRGLERFEGNEHTRRGTYFEPALIRWYLDVAEATDVAAKYLHLAAATSKPKEWSVPQLVVRHQLFPWARATPDILVTAKPIGNGDTSLLCVDVKCPSSQSRKIEGGAWQKQWDEATQVAPLHYVAQVQFQVGVCRAAGIPVVAGELAAGPFFGRLHRVLVEPDAAFFSLALAKANEFRDAVASGAPLPPLESQGATHV